MTKIAGFDVTDAELRALAYVVPDPEVWIEHVMKTFEAGRAELAVRRKLDKCVAVVSQVPDLEYATRAERDAADRAANAPTAADIQLERELILVDLKTRLATAEVEELDLATAKLSADIAALEAIVIPEQRIE